MREGGNPGRRRQCLPMRLCLREAALHMLILDCRPLEPGIISEARRTPDRPRVVVLIRFARVNFCNPVELPVVIDLFLKLGHKDVSVIHELRIVEAAKSCVPILSIARHPPLGR